MGEFFVLYTEEYSNHKLACRGEAFLKPDQGRKRLNEIDPESLEDAFEKARDRGPGWRKRVDGGQKAMRRLLE